MLPRRPAPGTAISPRRQRHLLQRIAGGADLRPDLEVYPKTGTWGPLFGDAGIVRCASEHRLVAVAFVEGRPAYRGPFIARLTRRAVRRLLDLLIERQLAQRLDALFAGGDSVGLGALLAGDGAVEWVRYAGNQVTDVVRVEVDGRALLARGSTDGSVAVHDGAGEEVAYWQIDAPTSRLAHAVANTRSVVIAATGSQVLAAAM